MHPAVLPNSIKNFYCEKDLFEETDINLVGISIHRNCEVNMHSHEFYEIVVITKGSGYHYIEKMCTPIQTGDIFVLPPNVVHGYYFENNLEVYHLLLKKDFIKKYYNELSKVDGFSKLFEVEPYLRTVYNKNMFLHLSGTEFQSIKNKIEKIVSFNREKRFIHANVIALELICSLCHSMHTMSQSSKSDSEIEILNVLEYIQNHYDEKLTTESLLKLTIMSRATFNRHFKKMVKMSPMQYVINCRVSAAKLMVDEGKSSKTEIAQRCGFYDSSHMDKYLIKT